MLTFVVNVHVGCDPLHAPDHPEKTLFAAAVAVSVIDVPGVTGSTHMPGQLSTPSLEATEPCPDPDKVTVSVGSAAKPAVT